MDHSPRGAVPWGQAVVSGARIAGVIVQPMIVRPQARELIAGALPHIASGGYGGEHWLASFAVYGLTEK